MKAQGQPAVPPAWLSSTSTPRVSPEIRGVPLLPRERDLTTLTEISRPYAEHVAAADPATQTRLNNVAALLMSAAHGLAIWLPEGEQKRDALRQLVVVLALSRQAINPEAEQR